MIINTGPNVSGKVELGSTVLLKTDAREKLFQIVGSRETTPTRGGFHISLRWGKRLWDGRKAIRLQSKPRAAPEITA